MDATHEDGEDGIDHLARIDGTWATAGLRGRNEIFDTIPLAVGEIGWVGSELRQALLLFEKLSEKSPPPSQPPPDGG
ncbi:MAG: hypothetical protein WCK70_17805, partial [Chloroflexales bacterium]